MISESVFNEWVKALRSGEYKQTDGFLKDDDRFCCLGVLADIVDSCEWGNDGNWRNSNTNLPGQIIPDQQQEILVDLNDKERFSFGEIANYLEENKNDFVY